MGRLRTEEMNFSVRPLTKQDEDWVLEIIRGWGSDFIVTRGRKVYAAGLPGFVAELPDGHKLGLVTYEVIGDQCEIITLDAFEKFHGIGTALTKKVRYTVASKGCERLWLIAINDNIDAIRFYQKRGFSIAAVHVNALELSRKLKPSIPQYGQHNIPMRDEIEFEMWL
jgi:ribosomal protein S18 acetylase RimI-like enzyme